MTFQTKAKHRRGTKVRHRLTGKVFSITYTPDSTLHMFNERGELAPTYVIEPWVTRGERATTPLAELMGRTKIVLSAEYLDNLDKLSAFEIVRSDSEGQPE